jgi:hypothetical protein
MNQNLNHFTFHFLLISLLSCLMMGCSVSSSGQKYGVSPSLPENSSPQDPENQSPVLVTSPVNLIPEVETVPSEPPTQPQLVDLIQPDPELPPMLIIEETPITSPAPAYPESAEEPAPVLDMEDSVVGEDEAPPSLVEAVEQIEFEGGEGEPEEEVEIENPEWVDEDSPDFPDRDEPTEVVVEGSCFGKSKVAIMFSHKKFKSKGKSAKKIKSRTVNCKNGHYKIRVKGKKKHLHHLEVQAAYY